MRKRVTSKLRLEQTASRCCWIFRRDVFLRLGVCFGSAGFFLGNKQRVLQQHDGFQRHAVREDLVRLLLCRALQVRAKPRWWYVVHNGGVVWCV